MLTACRNLCPVSKSTNLDRAGLGNICAVAETATEAGAVVESVEEAADEQS